MQNKSKGKQLYTRALLTRIHAVPRAEETQLKLPNHAAGNRNLGNPSLSWLEISEELTVLGLAGSTYELSRRQGENFIHGVK